MKGNKQKLFTFLKSRRLLSLATNGNTLSICTVYYAINDNFNLYFISEEVTEHGKNISKNREVVCSIADTTQKVTDKKIGVQIKGKAQIVKNDEQLKIGLRLWNKANPGFEHIINLENMRNKIIKGKFYQVIPKTIKFFSEELYGPEGFEVFEF